MGFQVSGPLPDAGAFALGPLLEPGSGARRKVVGKVKTGGIMASCHPAEGRRVMGQVLPAGSVQTTEAVRRPSSSAV